MRAPRLRLRNLTPAMEQRIARHLIAEILLQPGACAADAGCMKRPTDPRLETRRTVRRGERTIDVRVITYPPGKRKR